MANERTYPVKGGSNEVIGQFTIAQALRLGKTNMPADLKRAGFECVIFKADPKIHGSEYLRINYGKQLPARG